MTAEQEKIVQYLSEAQASERALTRVLQAQIAMTPRGTYRTALDTHLQETREHAERVGRRLKRAARRAQPAHGRRRPRRERRRPGAGARQDAVRPRPRRPSGEEKVLKNAKDAGATEALEIATYAAIERLARSVGDRHDGHARRLDPRRRGEDARRASCGRSPS